MHVCVCVSVDGCVHGSVHISGIVHSLYTCTRIHGCNEYKYKYKLHRPRGSKFEQWYGPACPEVMCASTEAVN